MKRQRHENDLLESKLTQVRGELQDLNKICQKLRINVEEAAARRQTPSFGYSTPGSQETSGNATNVWKRQDSPPALLRLEELSPVKERRRARRATPDPREPAPGADSRNSRSGSSGSEEEVERRVSKHAYTRVQPRDFKLPTFSGRMGEDAMAWWRKVENEFSMYNLSWTVQRGVIYRNLAGAAQVWFDSLPTPQADENSPLKSFSRFKKAFLGKFTAQDTKLVAEYNWTKRKQRVGEDVDEYINEMVILGHQIGATDHEKFKTILRGLLPDIQAAVMKMKPANLDDLITDARIASASSDLTDHPAAAAMAAISEVTEAVRGIPEILQNVVQDGQKQIQTIVSQAAPPAPVAEALRGSTTQHRYGPPETVVRQPRPTAPRESSCYICGQNSHWKDECPVVDPQCTYCGASGHLRVTCRQLKRLQRMGRSFGQKTNRPGFDRRQPRDGTPSYNNQPPGWPNNAPCGPPMGPIYPWATYPPPYPTASWTPGDMAAYSQWGHTASMRPTREQQQTPPVPQPALPAPEQSGN
jgi:hypothetical protein